MGAVHRRLPDGGWDGVAPRAYESGRRHDLISGPSGRASVTLGDAQHELGPGDVVYVAPDELHCFEAIGDEPLGFVCVAPPAVTSSHAGS